MSSKVHHLNPPGGLRELYTLIEIFNDKDKYTSLVNEIETKRAEANDLISLIGPAKDIHRLRTEAESLNNTAKQNVAIATERARVVIKEAKHEAEKVTNRARDIQEKTDQALLAFNADKESLTNAMTVRQEALTKGAASVARREKDAELLMKQAQEIKQKYDGKYQNLKKAMGE